MANNSNNESKFFPSFSDISTPDNPSSTGVTIKRAVLIENEQSMSEDVENNKDADIENTTTNVTANSEKNIIDISNNDILFRTNNKEQNDTVPNKDEEIKAIEKSNETTPVIDNDEEKIVIKKTKENTLGNNKAPDVLNNEKKNYSQNIHQQKIVADIAKLNFSPAPDTTDEDSDIYIREMAARLEKVLKDFNIEAKVVEVATGPVITRYEITIEKGIRLSKITGLSDNIALSLAAKSIRIIAPIPGKSVIGIEIPNKKRRIISLRDVIDSDSFWKTDSVLPIALGKSISGEGVITDLSATPHLLVAGATGSGKSVCVNSIICSLLFKLSPQEVRFLMIDPKMVELAIYNDIPHLLSPVIIDPKKASLALRWVIAEMESRYYLLEKNKVRSIQSYNEMIRKK